jgi:hypothetical protein
MGKLVGLVLGAVAIFNGFAVLAAEDCQSVSFDGQGSRVAVAQCFADSSGALPAWMAGLGMVLIGGFVILMGVKRNRRS